eukprot:11564047-Prorocentrum_lima.AAC.1
MEEAAQQAATYLQDRHWARPLEIPPLRRLYKVIHDDVIVDTADFRVAEITVAISNLKKRKATGVDSLPAEAYQWLPRSAHRDITDLINDWWNSSTLPEEVTRAR